ncbi:DUF4870 domain-containing protein [Actinomadura rupiterrae]|uniref:DUF4870 domain-containing protein n=1 Tax=Actinomadura rupiterrae TaxID=559627 RepID=UPI0020A391A0|nr:DUF4870 domain-containing protein [Actinomadura rupiterrae]MCP2338802.1 putative Tic20 family protein [Actinomadura rupiterrae]
MAYGPPPQQPGPWQQPQNAQQWQQGGRDWQQPSPQSWQQPPAGQGYQPPPGQGYQQQPPAGQGWQQPPAGAQGGWQGAPPANAPAPAPEPENYGEIGYDETTWALMAYIGQFLVTIVAPAVVYLGKARHPFVRRHAAQGLNMGIASVAVWAVGGLISLLLPAVLWVLVLFSAVEMVFLVYAARAANRGEFRRVPPFIAWPLVK